MRTEIIKDVAAYYSGKLRDHGASAHGVDWRDQASQWLRFDQLLTVVRDRDEASLSDFGCGYGELLGYLRQHGFRNRYIGFDVAEDMIAAARQRFGNVEGGSFHVGATSPEETDYAVASGLFNVRLHFEDESWEAYIRDILDELDRSSRRGFACNFLTSYSDAQFMRADLYYADPRIWFDHCIRRFGRQVALLHDYGLFEFTLVVRKEFDPQVLRVEAQ